MDVDTGQVASELFFSANLCLKVWMEMMEPGAIVFSSAAISTGLEMCSFEPFGTPAKSLSRMT
jgi:hypothetical protein